MRRAKREDGVSVTPVPGEAVSAVPDWEPTHYIGETPVMRVERPPDRRGKGGKYTFVTESGKEVVPNSLQGRPLWPIASRHGGIDFSLEETLLLIQCVVAPNGRASDYHGRVAEHRGGRVVAYSRPENGLDVRYEVVLPETFYLELHNRW